VVGAVVVANHRAHDQVDAVNADDVVIYGKRGRTTADVTLGPELRGDAGRPILRLQAALRQESSTAMTAVRRDVAMVSFIQSASHGCSLEG
jgi:hypothetical protein